MKVTRLIRRAIAICPLQTIASSRKIPPLIRATAPPRSSDNAANKVSLNLPLHSY